MVREIMRELGREGEYQDTNDDFVYVEGKGYVYNTQGELYMRSAGEIEARNVAQRAGMSARERRERGFNETLDRRAEEAIVYDVNDYYYSYRWNALRYHAQNERSGAVVDAGASTNLRFTNYDLRFGNSAAANMDKVYRDPADGKEKFVIPTANARLSTGFTLGQLKSPVGGHKDASLGAILEYPELYEAYPELRNMRVRLYNPRVQDGTGGFFARPQGKEAG